MEIFQRAPVQASNFATDEEEIRQQLIDLPAVCLGVVFEHDHVEIEGGHAAENVDLRSLGVDLHDVRLGQDARRPGLDLDRGRQLLADIVEARLPAIVAAEIEIFKARVADGEIVQADRLPLERPEVLLEQRKILWERLVAVDVAPGQRLSAQAATSHIAPISRITGRVARYGTSYSPLYGPIGA